MEEGIHAALRIRCGFPGTGGFTLFQHVERRPARELMDGRGGVGYLLKDRVSDIGGFLDTLERVRAGGTAFDPEVIRQLIAVGDTPGTRLASLTERERSMLALIAEGHSNVSIGETLYISQSGIEKHINTIFTRLGLDTGHSFNRRVLAVLAFLGQE